MAPPLAAIAFLKGRFVLGIVALHISLIGIYAALRLATPTSSWAHRRYRGETLAHSQQRVRPGRPAARRRNRMLDGGAPSVTRN